LRNFKSSKCKACSFKYGNTTFGGVCASFDIWKGPSLLSWSLIHVVRLQKVQ
jgi:hypothetical protein